MHLLLLSPELLADNSPLKNVHEGQGRAGGFSADFPYFLCSTADFSVLLCLILGEGVGEVGELQGQSRIEGGEILVPWLWGSAGVKRFP